MPVKSCRSFNTSQTKKGNQDMEFAETSWLTKLRQKYNLLLFLATAAIPALLWGLIILINVFAGAMFTDPNQLGMDLFMTFGFPLIAAPIISGIALLIAKLMTIRGIRVAVIIGLGVAVPLGAYLLALAGHWIARMLYAGNKAEVPAWLFGTVAA